MLTIEVELLCGRYSATAHDDRSRAEWPPHPARFFSALVAALYDQAQVDQREREALSWLERQPAPSLNVDLDVTDHVGRRDVCDVYVPVNDVSLIGDPEKSLRDARAAMGSLAGAELTKAQKTIAREEKNLAKAIAGLKAVDEAPPQKAIETAIALMPHRRTRQVRTFPVVFPRQRTFSFGWESDPTEEVREALSRLCDRVTRLGHSSSLVRCAVIAGHFVPNLVPTDEGTIILRIVGPGQLARLDAAFARHQGVESRILPALPQRYGRPRGTAEDRTKAISGAFSDEWIVFERVGGARPLSSRGADLSRALRRALIEQHGARPLPHALSGHRADGGPADLPHIAFVSLPFVNHEHADGSLQGCAVVLPRGLSEVDRKTLFQMIAGWERDREVESNSVMELAGESLPGVKVKRMDLPTKISLRPETWSRVARRFVTALPIALDRNPGNLRSNKLQTAHKAAVEAQRFVADACQHIGLPRPISVEISSTPFLAGAQPVRAFQPWPIQRGRAPRVKVHADIRFDTDVRGPVVLGAGRFYGLGLCLPISEESGS